MKFLIEEHAQIDIKQAINWLSKKTSPEVARDTIKGLIYDVKNQLLAHPLSGKICQYNVSDRYREIIKGDYRTVYKVEELDGETHIIIILFCHVRMEYQTLLSQSNMFAKRILRS